MSHGKKYRAALEKLEAGKLYSLEEAVSLAQETSTTKFDSSVEIHMNLNIDPTKADQILRATVTLPHGTGKKVRVVAFVDESKASKALAAGALKAGSDDLIAEIEKGWLDFDVAVAEPEQMKKIGKIARTLGQQGLMPNPKAGTIGPDVEKMIQELQKGKMEFRNDKTGNLHNIVGKVSFDTTHLKENVEAYIQAILNHRPSGVKGNFIKSITLTTSMGPGIHLDVSAFRRQS